MSNLTIREVADRFGLTLRSLRFWEDKGLIKPARAGHTRFYAPDQVATIERIVPWSRAGITLRDIRMLLRMIADGQPHEAHVARRLAALRTETLARLAAIDALTFSPLAGEDRAAPPEARLAALGEGSSS